MVNPNAFLSAPQVKEVIGFIPPWEAFCNQRCGLYQDSRGTSCAARRDWKGHGYEL